VTDYSPKKHSLIGWIPKEWEIRSLSKLAEIDYGISDPLDKSLTSGIPLIGMPNVTKDGYFRWNEKFYISPERVKERNILKTGDILFNWRNGSKEHLGKTVLFNLVGQFTHVGFLLRIRCGANLNPKYCDLYIKSVKQRGYFLKAKSQVNNTFNKEELSILPIACPSLEEQNLIVDIIGIWDLAIEKTERLVTAKEKHLKYLITSLANNNIHHRAFVRDIATELSERNNGEQCKRVLSVTNINGFVLPENQFERRVASENLSNYKLVRQGQYAYNPSRINVGSIARLDDWPEGVLSPMYVVFSLNENIINSDFFLYWLSSYEARERIKRSAQGSVRETVGFQSFGDISIPLPPLDTQLKFSALLNIAKKEIDLLKKQLQALRKQKRGLMQKLLTGERRVKTAVEEG
jgi:type I restriction enzyme S subunit